MQKQFFSNNTIKFLKFSIFIMTILICVGTIFLIYGLKNKYDSLKLKKSEIFINLPENYDFISFNPDNKGNLWFELKNSKNNRKLLLISPDGEIIKEINF